MDQARAFRCLRSSHSVVFRALRRRIHPDFWSKVNSSGSSITGIGVQIRVRCSTAQLSGEFAGSNVIFHRAQAPARLPRQFPRRAFGWACCEWVVEQSRSVFD